MAIKFLSGLNLSNVDAGSLLKLDSNGNIVAAVANTDYATLSSAVWSTSGSNPTTAYYTGNVRVGTYQASVEASARLHVFDYQTTTPKLLIEDGNTGDASMEFKISTQSYVMGIDNSDSDKFKLSASTAFGTSDVLTISSGNVGIGTTSPSAKLDVAGQIITSDSVRFTGNVSTPTGNSVFRPASNTLAFGTSSTERMRIDSSGNVGIGTTSPATKLHVYNQGTAMIRVDSDSVSPYKAGIEFIRSSINGGRIYNDGGAVQVKIESDFGYDSLNPTRGGFVFRTAPVTSGTLVDALRIDARGYVGIGTTSPNEKLHVVGDSVITGGLAVGEHTSINPDSFVIDAYRSSTATSGDSIGLHTLRYQWSGTNTGRIIGTYSAAQTSNTSTLTTAIGVYGTARHQSSGTLTNAYSLYLDSPSGSPTNAYNIYAAGSANNYIGGSLGIGSTTPSAKLHVVSTGDNGSAGLQDYGFVVTSSSTDQPTLGAESIGDGYANLNLGSNISGTRRFWHISKRKSGDSHQLSFYYYNGTSFAENFVFRTDGTLKMPSYGAGLLKTNASGEVSLDTNTYLTTTSASSTYLPLTGGTVANGNTAIPLTISRTTATTMQVGVRFYAEDGVNDPTDMYFGAGTDSEPYWATSANLSAGNMIWHEGNDGAGSGLDADTLDGQQGSYYLDYNNFTNTPTISESDTLDTVSDRGSTTNQALTMGASATSGGRILSANYSGSSRLGVISSEFSSGDLLLGYGAEGKSGSAGFVSTYENFSGAHSVLQVASSSLDWRVDSSNSQTTIGNDLTLTSQFSVSRTGVLTMGDGFTSTKGNTAYDDRNKWDGGATGLVAATGRTSLGLGTAATSAATDFVAVAGDTMTGNLLLNNGVEIRSNDAGGTARTIMRVTSGDVLQYGWSGSGAVQFMGGGSYTERMRIHTDGNVGIGTTSPDSKLHIEATTDGTGSGADAVLHVKQNGGWNANQPWALYVEGYSYLNGFRINAADGIRALHKVDSGGQLGFSVTDTAPITFTQSNSTERMRVHTNGFVGIGTASPNAKLHVWTGEVSGSLQEVARLQGNWTSNPSGPLLRFTNQHDSGDNPNSGEYNLAGIAGIDDNSSWGGSLYFYTSPTGDSGGADLSTRMVIKSSGNVGIGTTSPSTKLDVAGSVQLSYSDPVLTLYDTGASSYGTTNARIEFNNSYATVGYVQQTGEALRVASTGGISSVSLFTNGSDRLFVNSSGSVGIGTTSPESYYSDKLVVNAGNEDGITIVGGTSDINYLMFADGTVGNARYRGMVWYNHSTDMMAFSTSGSNRMYIDASGNVGIGTTSPSTTLHVNGTITAPGIKTENAATVLDNSGLQPDQGSTEKTVVFKWSGTEIASLNNEGYFTASGYKTSGTTGYLKSDGTVDTSTFASSSSIANMLETGDILFYLNGGDMLQGDDIALSGLTASYNANTTTWTISGASPTHNHDSDYVKLSGSTMTGDLQSGSNQLLFGQGNVSAPSTTDQHAGTRILLYPLTAGQHYAIGIESNTMWFNSDSDYKWYSDTSNKMTLNSSGNLTIAGTFTDGTGTLGGAAYKSVDYFAAASHTHAAGDITSGTLSNARLPELLDNKFPYMNTSTGVFMPMVKGGLYTTQTSSVTGALKIVLPSYKSNMMLSITVDIYEYNSDRSATYRVGGYNYDDTGATWYNTFAYCLQDSDNRNLPVYFFSDTTNNQQYIVIGTTSTTWSYPQVVVRDVMGGFQTSISELTSSWSVSFTTTLSGSITASHTGNNQVITSWDRVSNTPTTISGYGITDGATTSYVDTAISNLVDSAPTTLNTLNELAAALGDDANFSTTVTTALGNRLRVDADQGLTTDQQSTGRSNLGLGTASTSNSGDFATSSHTHDWTQITSGDRTNYTLGFRAPTSNYAGFSFTKSNGDGGGYLLIRGTSDNDVYTAEGITLVADGGWLTLAQRTQTDKGIRFMTGSTSSTRMVIANGGNVGIGTTSADVKLHVNSAGTVNSQEIVLGLSSTSLRPMIQFSESAGVATGNGMSIEYDGRLSSGNNKMYINGVDNSPKLTVMSSGNVGIGTDSPTSKLHVVGDTQLTGVTTFTEAGTGSGTRLILSGASQYYNFFVGKQYNVSDTFEITPSTAAGGTTFSTPALVVNSSGKVGIGTTSPTAPLDVPANTSTYKVAKLGNDTTYHYTLTGLSNHGLTLTCGSYFMAEVTITAQQTNDGGYNNLYIRGIWSNNHTNHHWDELENVGYLTGSSFTITNGQNGDTTNSGKLDIQMSYTSGSFSSLVVRVVEMHTASGSHSYTIS